MYQVYLAEIFEKHSTFSTQAPKEVSLYASIKHHPQLITLTSSLCHYSIVKLLSRSMRCRNRFAHLDNSAWASNVGTTPPGPISRFLRKEETQAKSRRSHCNLTAI